MRIIDLVVSSLAFVILSPFFAIIILILRLTGEGEVFFLQQRIGQKGHAFKVIKFATMLKNSPNMGSGTITSKNDQRILPVGKYLRKTKINELPQLVNVLTGDMTLIGPRPHAIRDLEGIPSSDLSNILQLKPGLSGVASIVFRNEEEILSLLDDPRPFYDGVIAPYKAKLELWYKENKSISLNIQLILLTVFSVLSKKSVSLHRFYKDLPHPPDELLRYIKKD